MMSILSRRGGFVVLLLTAVASHAFAQTERRTLSGDRVAIYNLAGRLRVQPGSGSQVQVDVTRAGRDGSQLNIATGDIRGFQALRIIYPSNRVVYSDMGYNSQTQLRVNDD